MIAVVAFNLLHSTTDYDLWMKHADAGPNEGFPAYAKKLKAEMGAEVDYAKAPAEDFASVLIEFETPDGGTAIGEATTSWSFIGAGLRLSAELLGPEYSMKWNSLDSGLQLFFSREVKGRAGEDLVEKQNAEQGVMPVVPEEYAAYGYTAEDRHFVRAFLGKEQPLLTWDDGVDVVRILMTAYQSAEQGKTLAFPPKGIEKYVPGVARGIWRPCPAPWPRAVSRAAVPVAKFPEWDALPVPLNSRRLSRRHAFRSWILPRPLQE